LSLEEIDTLESAITTTLIPILPLIFLAVICAGLTFWDAYSYRLPDILTLPLLLVGAIYGVHSHGSLETAVGALIGGGSFWLVAKIYFRTKQIQGLGQGDVKLMLAAGAWCGASLVSWVIFIGASSALIFVGLRLLYGMILQRDQRPLASVPSKKPFGQNKIPFGAFLAPALFLVILIDHQSGAL
jgi:leader peptidase (prepilin peptidase)/N-methyltransferase